VTLSATLTSGGRPIAGRAIDFHLGAIDLGAATTDVAGVATLAGPPDTLHPGTSAAVTARFAGDKDDTPSAAAPTTLTVVAAPLTVAALDQAKIYGAPLPGSPLGVSYAGFVLGQGPASLGGSLSVTTTATALSHAGTYPIVPGGLTSDDYAIAFVNGQFRVPPARLVIVANDATKLLGAPLTPLSATYFGLVVGDTPASLTTPARLSTVATQSSPAGKYPIVVDSAASPDYTISYVDGTLTIISPVVSSRIGRARVAVVTTLYRDILARLPEPAGLHYWRRALAGHSTITSVAVAIAHSTEHRALVLSHRAPRISLATAVGDAKRAGQRAFAGHTNRTKPSERGAGGGTTGEDIRIRRS
jgi:hypothetical protein